MAKILNSKQQAFLEHYFASAERNATHAARLAGYKDPVKMAPKLKKYFSQDIASKELELAEASVALGNETHKLITSIARDLEVPVTARLKALELLAKVNGLMSDKVSLSVDRAGLEAELTNALKQLGSSSSSPASSSIPLKH